MQDLLQFLSGMNCYQRETRTTAGLQDAEVRKDYLPKSLVHLKGTEEKTCATFPKEA